MCAEPSGIRQAETLRLASCVQTPSRFIALYLLCMCLRFAFSWEDDFCEELVKPVFDKLETILTTPGPNDSPPAMTTKKWSALRDVLWQPNARIEVPMDPEGVWSFGKASVCRYGRTMYFRIPKPSAASTSETPSRRPLQSLLYATQCALVQHR